MPRRRSADDDSGSNGDRGRLGLAVRPLTPQERDQVGVPGGLLVEDASGPAADAGIQPGDVVLSVDGSPREQRAAVARQDSSARQAGCTAGATRRLADFRAGGTGLAQDLGRSDAVKRPSMQEKNREVVTYAAGKNEQMPDSVGPRVPVVKNVKGDT